MTASDPKSPGGSAGVLTKTRTRTQRPPLYKVLLLNDDYTPMEFVVHVLERFFGTSHQQALEIMMTVHRKGLAVVGRLLLRDRRDQGHPGDGLRPAQPAPAAMHHGKGVGPAREARPLRCPPSTA